MPNNYFLEKIPTVGILIHNKYFFKKNHNYQKSLIFISFQKKRQQPEIFETSPSAPSPAPSIQALFQHLHQLILGLEASAESCEPQIALGFPGPVAYPAEVKTKSWLSLTWMMWYLVKCSKISNMMKVDVCHSCT